MNNSQPVGAVRMFGGFVFGACVAAALCVGALALLSLSPSYTGEHVFGLLVLAVIGIPVSAILGGLIGIVTVRRLGTRPAAKVISRIGYGLLLGVVIPAGLLMFHRSRQDKLGYKAKVDAATVQWESAYGSKYPRLAESLPALLGPLYYPGMRMERWNTQPSMLPAWQIAAVTEDGFEQVVEYYMSIEPEGLGAGNTSMDASAFTTSYVPSVDGRETNVRFEPGNNGSRLVFETRPFKANSSVLQVMPGWTFGPGEDIEAWKARIVQARAPEQQVFEKFWDGCIYPGSTVRWGRYAPGRNVYQSGYVGKTPVYTTGTIVAPWLEYKTTDTLANVLNFYKARRVKLPPSEGIHFYDGPTSATTIRVRQRRGLTLMTFG
ncbi:MAG: hypothetical protein ACR2IE_15915 [Candidatus Sumerlaeaceae bacterium]